MGTGQGGSLTLNSAFRLGFTGTLGVGLAIALMTAVQSVATVLIYRLVSFILPAVVGWIVYLVGYGGDRRKDVESDAGAERAESAERPANTESADVDGTNARTDGRE